MAITSTEGRSHSFQDDSIEKVEIAPIHVSTQREKVLFVRGLFEPAWMLRDAAEDAEEAGYEATIARSRFPLNFVFGEMEAVAKEATEMAERQGGPVTGIGHSLGGLILDLLQNERPDLIKRNITMGSPLNLPFIPRHRKPEGATKSIYIHTDHVVPFFLSKHKNLDSQGVSPIEMKGIKPTLVTHYNLPSSRNVQRAVREALTAQNF